MDVAADEGRVASIVYSHSSSLVTPKLTTFQSPLRFDVADEHSTPLLIVDPGDKKRRDKTGGGRRGGRFDGAATKGRGGRGGRTMLHSSARQGAAQL